jgi:hypothetical protein
MIWFSGDEESQDELEKAFSEAGIEVGRPACIKAKAGAEIVSFLTAAGHLTPIALCVCAWLKQRYKTRKLIVERKDGSRIEIEAGSPEEIEEILKSAETITIERKTDDA